TLFRSAGRGGELAREPRDVLDRGFRVKIFDLPNHVRHTVGIGRVLGAFDDGDRARRAEVTLNSADGDIAAHPRARVVGVGLDLGGYLVIHAATNPAKATSSCPIRASRAGRRPRRRIGASCASWETSRSAPGTLGITRSPESSSRRPCAISPPFGNDRSHRPVCRAFRPPWIVTPHTGASVRLRASSSTGAPTPVASTATVAPRSASAAA